MCGCFSVADNSKLSLTNPLMNQHSSDKTASIKPRYGRGSKRSGPSVIIRSHLPSFLPLYSFNPHFIPSSTPLIAGLISNFLPSTLLLFAPYCRIQPCTCSPDFLFDHCFTQLSSRFLFLQFLIITPSLSVPLFFTFPFCFLPLHPTFWTLFLPVCPRYLLTNCIAFLLDPTFQNSPSLTPSFLDPSFLDSITPPQSLD